MKLSTFALVVAGCACLSAASARAQTNYRRPIGNPPPLAVNDLYVHDTEGKEGLVDGIYVDLPGVVSCRWGFEDGTEDFLDGSLIPLGKYSTNDAPFWWETTTPWTKVIRGWSRTSDNYPKRKFMLPLPCSSLGLRGRFFTGGTDTFYIQTAFGMADSIAIPSPLVFGGPNGVELPGHAAATYLPGNEMENVGGQIEDFVAGSLSGWLCHAFWGNYVTNPSPASTAHFSTELPVGPFVYEFGLDGMTTDTLHVNMKPGTAGIIRDVLLVPLPDSEIQNATQQLNFGPAPPFIIRGSIVKALVFDTLLTTDLQAECDTNGDGILDASDYH